MTLSLEAFERHLRRTFEVFRAKAAGSSWESYLENLYALDWFLCCACLEGQGRAWEYLFHAWLPGSGYQPTHDPALEVYRSHPAEAGWDPLDIDCCLPVRPLRRR